MLAARITLPHFSVSSAMSFRKSAGEPGGGPAQANHRRRAPAERAGGGPLHRRADRSSPSPAKRICSGFDINMHLDECQRAKKGTRLIGQRASDAAERMRPHSAERK